MIVKKHLKQEKKADMLRVVPPGKKPLKPVRKEANAAKAAAENRNPENRQGAELLRPGA